MSTDFPVDSRAAGPWVFFDKAKVARELVARRVSACADTVGMEGLAVGIVLSKGFTDCSGWLGRIRVEGRERDRIW